MSQISTDPQKDCVVSASKASILFCGSSTFRLWKSCTVHSVVHVLHVCLDLWCVSVQAYNMGLTTENHLWMFPAWYNAGWWNTSVDGTTSEKNCTREQVRDKVVLSSHLPLFSLLLSHQHSHVWPLCPTFPQMQEAVTFSLFLDSYNYDLDPNATTDTLSVS